MARQVQHRTPLPPIPLWGLDTVLVATLYAEGEGAEYFACTEQFTTIQRDTYLLALYQSSVLTPQPPH